MIVFVGQIQSQFVCFSGNWILSQRLSCSDSVGDSAGRSRGDTGAGRGGKQKQESSTGSLQEREREKGRDENRIPVVPQPEAV